MPFLSFPLDGRVFFSPEPLTITHGKGQMVDPRGGKQTLIQQPDRYHRTTLGEAMAFADDIMIDRTPGVQHSGRQPRMQRQLDFHLIGTILIIPGFDVHDRQFVGLKLPLVVGIQNVHILNVKSGGALEHGIQKMNQ